MTSPPIRSTSPGSTASSISPAKPGVRSFGAVFADYVRHNLLATQRVSRRPCPPACASSRLLLVDLRRRGDVPDTCAATPGPAPRTVHEARLRAPRLRVRRSSDSTRSCSGTSPSTGRGSAPTWRSRDGRGAGIRTQWVLYGDGSRSRSFTYVDDAVAATIAAMEQRPRHVQRRRRRGGDDERGDRAARADRGRTLDVRIRPMRRATSCGRRRT